jgi:cytochrome c oxidase accessory protein FixG
MFLDFAWFRDQMCVVACPYARLQSVLIDRKSLIVAYDATRGEPRGKLEKTTLERKAGDCVDCGACVTTCPTGIDIRKGLQLECIGCTQCIDACDNVMDRIKRPRGLILYTSQAALETGLRPKILRPRVVLYPVLLLVIAGLFAFAVARRGEAEVTVLRGLGDAFSMQPDGSVANLVRVRVDQHGDDDGKYLIALEDSLGQPLPDVTLVVPENPLHVRGGQSVTTTAFVLAPAKSFHSGVRRVMVKVSDGDKLTRKLPFSLFGPAGGAAP